VVEVAVLFPGVGSGVVDVTDTLFVSVPVAPGDTVPVIVIVTLAFGASVPSVHTLFPVLGLGLAELKMNPLGYVSVTTTPAAFDGPLFVTTRVYVRLWPAITGSGLSLLVIETSACAFTWVVEVAVLSLGSGSAVVEATLTLFVSVPVAPGDTVPVIVIVTLAFGASVPSAHTLFPLVGAGLAELNVNPLGYVSVTTKPWASDGPWFVTTKVYVKLCPAITGSGLSAFVIDTSA